VEYFGIGVVESGHSATRVLVILIDFYTILMLDNCFYKKCEKFIKGWSETFVSVTIFVN
jgi:hypothetical protein